MRPGFTWRLRSRTLELGPRTLIMGVLNVTPDSFSDGGRFFEPRAAVERGLELLDAGADILDIGGESTRPGALAVSGEPAVSAEEELRRVIPVIEELLRRRPEAVISIDSYKAQVARAAVEAGAEIANDVSGLRWDAQMAATLGRAKVRRGTDAHARTAGGVAHAAAARRSRGASQPRVAGNRRIGSRGRNCPRTHRARSWLWIRQELRRKLSFAGAPRRAAQAGIPAAGGGLAEVVHRTDVGHATAATRRRRSASTAAWRQ